MKRRHIYAILILCLLLAATGCSRQPSNTPAPSATPNIMDYLNIDPEQRPEPQKIILYYMHKASGFFGARDPDRGQR